jgi:subtilisin family serine protease
VAAKLILCGLIWVLGSMTAFAADGPMRPRGTGNLLVRVEGTLASLSKASEATNVAGYTLRPLFTGPALETKSGESVMWFLAQAPKRLASGSGWTEAYAFVRDAREARGHPAFSAVRSIYAEPDQEQEAQPNSAPPATGWPTNSHFAWHLRDEYTQLLTARKNASGPCIARIVILDTGINPVHATKPRYIDLTLAHNFVDEGHETDVTDPGVAGVFHSIGHGTATMALLAGNRIRHDDFDDDLGGAPDAEVIPVRIADSVVHFWTSTMAQGIDFAAKLPREPGKDYCDVLSISMGGVASVAWADAVNRAYENGVFIAAAAGNNVGDFPSRYTVYPSRFARVTSVVGITAANTPYRTSENRGSKGMQGNFGPPSMTWKTIAAFTPNVPWARLKESNGQYSRDGIESDGAGTSAATPQVAAAASLWLAKNGADFPAGWQRVEAARWALLKTVSPSPAKYGEELGMGSLKAFDALSKSPKGVPLKEADAADVSFPFLRLLFGWDEPGKSPGPDFERMFEVEALNLALTAQKLALFATLPAQEARDPKYQAQRAEIAQRLLEQPDISPDLKAQLLKQPGVRP